MASLMENLMDILENEEAEYQTLLELSRKKTPVIIKGDVEQLTKITDEEQVAVDRINRLDKKRDEIMNDIANVINKDVKTLKLIHLVEMLGSRKEEQDRLADITDRLKITVKEMTRVNSQNAELIKDSLDMVQFDINLLKGVRTAPETANYNKGAYNTGSMMGGSFSGFDAKQ